MSDMSAVITPKSDQWNFDDFQTGPITFKIKAVKVKGGQDQPVDMTLEGTEKFYRPCKSMARVFVHAWGADSAQYIGRSMTLYGDPKVKWGGMEVGGIRISHMSDIQDKLVMALTATRGSKKPYTVQPLKVEAQAPVDDRPYSIQIAGAQTVEELGEIWKRIPKDDKELHLAAKDARKASLTTGSQV